LNIYEGMRWLAVKSSRQELEAGRHNAKQKHSLPQDFIRVSPSSVLNFNLPRELPNHTRLHRLRLL
jgi:hypothetical protein